MATTDYDVIKDIPGYKVILRAVLKSQIQQLVEQLASTADEESVILTASVADGTLSHLGSDSGKGFLEDHEDIKSQFLGFCLRSYHKKKQEQEQKAAELQQSSQASPGRYTSSTEPYSGRAPRYSPRGQGSVHPVSLTRASPGTRSQGVRHEPYTVSRPSRRSSAGFDNSRTSSTGPSASPGQVVKVETEDNETYTQSESDTSYQDSTGMPDQSTSQLDSQEAVSESSKHIIPNEPLPENPAEDSEASNVTSDTVQIQSGEYSEIDPNVSVKVEQMNDGEMELEITGVEPGRPAVSQDTWDPNNSMGMNFDPTGATGNQADMTNQGYSVDNNFALDTVQSNLEEIGAIGYQSEHQALQDISEFYFTSKVDGNTLHGCNFTGCGKVFKCRRAMERHIRTHTKEKPFACRFCTYKCARKDNLRVHEFKHNSSLKFFGDKYGMDKN